MIEEPVPGVVAVAQSYLEVEKVESLVDENYFWHPKDFVEELRH